MKVRIFRPSKTAMQSGRANTKQWVIEYEPSDQREIEQLMGWTSSRDTRRQLDLRFDSREEAVGFAERHGLAYELLEPRERKPRPKSYADNFSFKRVG